MKDVRSLRSSLAYFRELAGAILDGMGAARREIDAGVFKLPIQSVWAPAAVGGAIGILGGKMTGNRQRASRAVLGGLVGTALGIGAGVALASAPLLRPVARTAARRIEAIRDARWLAMHPIDYA
jgi:hypothetical protein